MPNVKNRLRQPLVIHVGTRAIHIGPDSSTNITDKEAKSPHVRRLESTGHLVILKDDDVSEETAPAADVSQERSAKERKKTRKKSRR